MLDEQVRRHESEGNVSKYEYWEFLRPIVDANGRCRGIVAQDLRTMTIRSFAADAVVMATGGPGLVFGKSTNSVMCTGAAAARYHFWSRRTPTGSSFSAPHRHPRRRQASPDEERLGAKGGRGLGTQNPW